MKIELEVSIPDGYEATGEYRIPKNEEVFLGNDGIIIAQQNNLYTGDYIILRKVAPAMRPMTSYEALWILTTPRCVIRHIDREEWEVPTIHAEYVHNYVYGFVNEDGIVTGVSKFEREV